MKFYKCELCGNIIEMVHESGQKVVCCGKEMKELIPGTTDGDKEKHVPVVKQDGCKICVLVGENAHPMEDSHYIQWIAIETTKGVHRKCLKPGERPKAVFAIGKSENLIAAYAYCNVHELWKCDICKEVESDC